MAWFDRHLGEEDPRVAWERLGRVLDSTGLTPALDAASGPRGLRRFIVRFEVRGLAPRVVGLDADTLARGGGPPNPAAFDANIGAVEAALRALRTRLGAWSFVRGAVGVVRDDTGELSLSFRFDEDVDDFGVADLHEPEGKGAPNEDPAYLKALGVWDARIAPIRARWLLPRADDAWTLEDGRLLVHGADGERAFLAEPIATWRAKDGLFAWMLDTPAGEEAPFVEPELTVEVNGAMELAVFAAARLGRVGLFQGELESGETLFAGLRE